MRRLAGKSALITGAARGIGLEFARAYVREGARVAIADIDIARARAAAAELGEAAIAIEIDVAQQDSIEHAITETTALLGGIDILINMPPYSQRRQSPKSAGPTLTACSRLTSRVFCSPCKLRPVT